jgi:hypothetical protein
MKTKHTPTPWEEISGSIYQHPSIGAAHIAGMDRSEHLTKPTERDANAAFIVKAVNNHERLAHIVKLFLDCFDDFEKYPQGKGYCLNDAGRELFKQARAVLAEIAEDSPNE